MISIELKLEVSLSIGIKTSLRKFPPHHRVDPLIGFFYLKVKNNKL